MIFDRDLHHSVAHFTLIGMKCKICKRDFEAARPDARFCGTNCRSTAYRARLQTAARAGLRAQSDPATDEMPPRPKGPSDEAEDLLPFGVVDSGPEPREPKSATAQSRAPSTPSSLRQHSARSSSAPPRPVALNAGPEPPVGDVNAMIETITQKLAAHEQMRQATELRLERTAALLQQKEEMQSQFDAALKKERKKRKKLRKKFESQWWAGGGQIPGWAVPLLAAAGGGLLVSLLSGGNLRESIGELVAGPEVSPETREQMKMQAQAAFLSMRNSFLSQVAKWQAHLAATPEREGKKQQREPESKSQATSPSPPPVPSPPPAPPPKEITLEYANYCVPWTMSREDAYALVTELTGARRRPMPPSGRFNAFDVRHLLVPRLLETVEPSLGWNRERPSKWSSPWMLYKACTSMIQLCGRIEKAATQQLPYKELPVTQVSLAFVEAARYLHDGIRRHLCRLAVTRLLTKEALPELQRVADRLEASIKSNRPLDADRLACALHDLLTDLHSLIFDTIASEQHIIDCCNGSAVIENILHSVGMEQWQTHGAELALLMQNKWSKERFGPDRPVVPPSTPSQATESSNGPLPADFAEPPEPVAPRTAAKSSAQFQQDLEEQDDADEEALSDDDGFDEADIARDEGRT